MKDLTGFLYRLEICRHICEDILERNRTSVSCVAKGDGHFPHLIPNFYRLLRSSYFYVQLQDKQCFVHLTDLLKWPDFKTIGYFLSKNVLAVSKINILPYFIASLHQGTSIVTKWSTQERSHICVIYVVEVNAYQEK